MSPKRTRKANELPYIPLGPFQWRIPGIHYKLEYVEFFQIKTDEKVVLSINERKRHIETLSFAIIFFIIS